MYELIVIIIAALFVLFVFVAKSYTVVSPNEAHVVVFMGRGRRIYSPSKGEKSSYFFIPFLMRRFKMPLVNRKIDIPQVHLNDLNVAPFECDVVAWLRISDPSLASERLEPLSPFESLKADLLNVVQAVARATAMKQQILDIMRDRSTFSTHVSIEVGQVLAKWGVELINLEVNDIRDDETKSSHIISDYEKMQQASVDSQARKQVAEKNREAVEVEQDNMQLAAIATESANEIAFKRKVEREKNVSLAQQEADMTVAQQKALANEQEIEALRKLEVGKASVIKEAAIEKATGEARAIQLKGQAEANVVQVVGEAEGAAIQAKGEAEAVVKDKMAEALKKFNESGISLEKIRAWVDVEKAKYFALGESLSKADLKLVQSGAGGSFFGFPMNAESGTALGQFLEGMDMSKVGEVIAAIKGEKKPASPIDGSVGATN